MIHNIKLNLFIFCTWSFSTLKIVLNVGLVPQATSAEVLVVNLLSCMECSVWGALTEISHSYLFWRTFWLVFNCFSIYEAQVKYWSTNSADRKSRQTWTSARIKTLITQKTPLEEQCTVNEAIISKLTRRSLLCWLSFLPISPYLSDSSVMLIKIQIINLCRMIEKGHCCLLFLLLYKLLQN